MLLGGAPLASTPLAGLWAVASVQTAYWIAHPTSTFGATPTGVQIAAGNLSSDAAADFSGSETGFATTGTVTITEQTATSGATASTGYSIAWVIHDTTEGYSNVVVGEITTLAAFYFSVAPTVTARTSNSYTIGGTLSETGSVYAVATLTSDVTDPTNVQIVSGLNGAGAAAPGTGSATDVTVFSFSITGASLSDNAAHDIHVVGRKAAS